MATWWTTVDGRVLPKPLAGHPGLELCNTWAGWGEAHDDRHEYLRDYTYLPVLAASLGIMSDERSNALQRKAARHPDEAHGVLEETRSLRTDLYAALTGRATGAAFGRVADAAASGRSRQVLVRSDEGASWAHPTRPTLGEPLDLFVLAATEVLTSDRVAAVRACPGAGCGWLFLGSGKRRWCQMAVCGNRAKQASYAARSRE
ncbi:CGNR zinc finger domain-containing protein [Luteipulveratus halotolerans]|uniref:Zinc finger CGNR domain-containing protein n=1 Tax=Luteipulveratus halotolerans TaxID=1631356 RepID=A0A0L6CDR0_9MICO|nr:CGNR zinc finger domain-containing protein [Luteipulveratus halotolerans]KNX36001.1 hypothetical protein VV01_00655 [Luteipulveratus halotolerans]